MKKNLSSTLSQWLADCPRRHIFVVLAALGLIAYANAIAHPLIHDDVYFLMENPAVRDFHFRRVFFHPLSTGVFGASVNLYYRPLLDLVNHGQYLLFGFNPHGFHFFNICLHILNSFLVYILLTRILPPTLPSPQRGEELKKVLSQRGEELKKISLPLVGRAREGGVHFTALLTAAVFLVHPVQTQAVACVSGISNLLFVCLGLCAFLLYIKSRYVLSLAVFGLSLLAKEQALIFPLLLAWFELCFGSSVGKRRIAARVGGWFAVAAAYLVLKQSLAGTRPLLSANFFDGDFWLRAAHIPHIVLNNLSLIVFPRDLHYFHSIDVLTPALPWIMAFGALILAGIALHRRCSVRIRRLIIFGAGWFLLSQALTINIFPLIWEYSTVSAAEHFLYLPMIGIVLPLAAALTENDGSLIHIRRALLAGVILVGVLTALTIRQNTYWASEVALFERADDFEKNLARVQSLLGRAYYLQGRFPEALTAYQRAYDRVRYYERAAFGEGPKSFYRAMLNDISRDQNLCEQAMDNVPQ